MTEQTVKAEMLIRRPLADVFDAFVLPGLLTQFWLSSASGPLAPGAQVTWNFMVPGAQDRITVTAFEPGRAIAWNWSDGSSVRVAFEAIDGNTTRVGFASAVAEHAIDATEGYAIVLCDLKVLLETGRSPGLVRDKAALIARAG